MKLFSKWILYFFIGTLILEPSVFAGTMLEAKCLNAKNKLSACTVENSNGNLIVTYKGKKNQALNRTIVGSQVGQIKGAEYSRRRVAEAVTLGLLVSPWALFTLFSKKKRENFAIQYQDGQNHGDSIVIQTKKKNALAMASLIEASSGKKVEYEPVPEKKKKKSKKNQETSVEATAPALAPEVHSATTAAAPTSAPVKSDL